MAQFVSLMFLAVGLVAIVQFVIAAWPLILGVVAVIVAGRLLSWWYHTRQDRIEALRAAERARITRLIRNADVEHQQVQRGDMAGIYGGHPPAPELAGLGIWLCDNANDPPKRAVA